MTYPQLFNDIVNYVTLSQQFQNVECPSCAGDLVCQRSYIISEFLWALSAWFEELEEEGDFDLTTDQYDHIRQAVQQGADNLFADVAQANQEIGCENNLAAWQERVRNLLILTMDNIIHASFEGYEQENIAEE